MRVFVAACASFFLTFIYFVFAVYGTPWSPGGKWQPSDSVGIDNSKGFPVYTVSSLGLVDANMTYLFWYGCKHCADFSETMTLIEREVSRTCPDRKVEKVPIVMKSADRLETMTDAAFHYGLQQVAGMEFVAENESLIYSDVQRGALGTMSKASVDEWASKMGVDSENLEQAMRSEEVKSKLDRSYALVRELAQTGAYRGVPAIVIGQDRIAYPSRAASREEAVKGVVELVC